MAINGKAGDAVGQACGEGRKAGGIAAGTKGIGQDHLVHLIGMEARIGQTGADHRGGEGVGFQGAEGPAPRHDSGAAGGDEEGSHGRPRARCAMRRELQPVPGALDGDILSPGSRGIPASARQARMGGAARR